jgi:hypothetical protein
MANVIKYSSTIQPNTIKAGPFVIGVNQGGYGSTSATGYWKGITPRIFGYVVYQQNGTNSPPFYVMKVDYELINFANNLAGGGITTIQIALIFFRNNATTYTCVNFDYPSIVTSGLTLNFDAGFTPSYPKGYTTISDISGSGNGYIGTLYNGPTYNSTYFGGIVLDGTNQYIRSSFTAFGTNTPWTMSCIFKAGTQTNYNGIISLGYLPVITMTTAGNLYMFWYNGSGYPSITTSGANYADNQPHNVTATYDGTTVYLYVDAILKGSSVSSVQALWNDFTLGMEYNNGPKCLNGTIYNAMVYNRALSANEVLQNYYAGLQRLIPTNGLILWLDGRNTNTQVITPTIATDNSSFDYNGMLMNGMGLAYRDGGISFSFDGVNNYIDLGLPYSIISANNNLTISVWFKRNSSAVGSLIKYGSAGWEIYLTPTGVGCILFTTTNAYSTTIVLNLSDWHNVTMTYNGTTFIVYIDGVAQYTSSSFPGPIFNQSYYGVNIGKDGYSNSSYFNGKISIVRGYNTTLTANEVLTIYNADKTRHGL